MSDTPEISGAIMAMQRGATMGDVIRRLETERNALRELSTKLAKELAWCADNNGECLGDHMQRLNSIRILLSKVRGA